MARSRSEKKSRTARREKRRPLADVEGRRRAIIEGVEPEIDAGRFPIKRTVGERVVVEADVFADGHEQIACDLLCRPPGKRSWRRTPLEPLGNDRWRGSFDVTSLGRWHYTVEGWVDVFGGWQRDLRVKHEAGQDVEVELEVGAELVRETLQRVDGKQLSRTLDQALERLGSGNPLESRLECALDVELGRTMRDLPAPERVRRLPRELGVEVDRERARFGAWYELFPRSTAEDPERHGSFRDLERWLPYVAGMGFDVLYLPPVHPIGRTHRKGPNNQRRARPGDPGSPWAIGSEEGGHEDFHPELGDEKDFAHLVEAAQRHGLEIALDIAFQCSPDHPWVEEHPEWFRHLPDGSIRHAENPPKKYEDIYPLDFDSEHWPELWRALERVFRTWIDRGVKIFRVDNPHTKPFDFWEWLIGRLRADHPELILLSEAFTRPRRLEYLAKVGFTQSYNYFPWRNQRAELEDYLEELTTPPQVEYLRANLWPNTPDILTEPLHGAGRPAFAQRFLLAATLGAAYGIYGPAFELMENVPRSPGSEEYLGSEKYQLRDWDLDRGDSLRDLITVVNRARHEHTALQHDRWLHFHGSDNDRLMVYSKRSPDGRDVVLAVVNLDTTWTQSGFTDLDLEALGVPADEPFRVHDLLSGERYLWQGAHNYVELNPERAPGHLLAIEGTAPLVPEREEGA